MRLRIGDMHLLRKKGVRVDPAAVLRVSKAKAALPKGTSARERGYHDLEDLFLFQIRAAGLPEPVREHVFDPRRKWRLDFAWPAYGLAVEVQGGAEMVGRHQRPAGFVEDCRKLATAAVLGWRILPLPTPIIRSGEGLELLRRALDAAAPAGPHAHVVSALAEDAERGRG